MNRQTKFLVFTDLHHGNIMPDCKGRLEKIIQAARDNCVDFIVNLGDFAWPCEENNWIREMWNGLDIPHYLVGGNHDFDKHTKEDFKQFYELENTYYSFEDHAFHYIVLDTNFYRYEGQDYDYAHGNYYSYDREYISTKQLEWLSKDIAQTDKPCILFSHAQLNYPSKNGGGCGNYQELHERLLELNKEAEWQKVCVAINGHNHTDSYSCWDGIHHIDINGASNQWLGEGCESLKSEATYDEQVHLSYPYLKYVIPYKEPLFAIVTLNADENQLMIEGRETVFIGPTPEERGHEGTMGGIPIQPKISHLNISLFIENKQFKYEN